MKKVISKTLPFATENPEKLQILIAQYEEWAQRTMVYPAPD